MRRLAAIIFAALLAPPALAIDRAALKNFVFIPPKVELNAKAVELGRRLFFDRRLSGDSTMNCATCHQPQEGFSDGLTVSAAYPTNLHFRNTPTVVNAAWRKRLTLDGRAGSVEEQALGPVGSPFEMNLNLTLMEEKLRGVPPYRSDFLAAFGGEPSKENIASALGAFERTLFASPSPFDRFASGEEGALGKTEIAGMELFFGKGGCSGCHTGPHFGGESYASLGLSPDPRSSSEPRRAAALRYFARSFGNSLAFGKEDDLGLGFRTGKAEDEGKFLVPTLRQLARTAPYGHDGRFRKLEDVLKFINEGGGPEPHKSSGVKPLGMEESELAALKAFLLALTGEDPDARPPTPPY